MLAGVLATAVAATQGSSVEAGQWVVVPPQSLEVPAGSPLDFSAMVPQMAGSRGSIAISGDQLVFSGDGSPARFNCAMVNAVGQRSRFPTHAEADVLALQLRRHGYTLVRQQFVDQRLTRRAQFDVDIDSEELDRFFYFQAALKRNGIAWMLDIVSGPGTGVRGQAWNPSSPDDLRVRMHFDPAARELWLKLVDAVFARTNPYTGLSTLADPALAIVVGANENSIAFGRSSARPFPTGFGVVFDRWVRAHFANPEALGKAISDLSTAERSGVRPVALPAGWNGKDSRTVQLLRFAASLEINTNRWMTARLAERGFHGPNIGHNDWTPVMTGETRAALPMIDVHAYGGEVTTFEPGTRFKLLQATTPEGLGIWTLNAAQRRFDRPMMVSEYDSPFPNSVRYESGLLLPAVAAFQQFGPICRMAFSSIETAIPASDGNAQPLRAYAIGLDPAERAAETLATMLYFRGDVAPARHTVAAVLDSPEFDRPGAAILPAGISRATLLTRFGLTTRAQAAELPDDALVLQLMDPDPSLANRIGTQLSRIIEGTRDAQIGRLIEALRSNGTLRVDNRTDIATGVFQSDTGEITVDQINNRIEIVTPRTEAASSKGPIAGLRLGQLEIKHVNAGALIAITTLDGKSINYSKRLLAVLSGDVRNRDAIINNNGDTAIFQNWGKLPMEMKRIQANITLRTKIGNVGKLTTLSLRGIPIDEQKLVGNKGLFNLKIDTARVHNSPTTFFLMEIE